MPRNSSGTYSLPAGNPVVANTLIETNWANPTMSDIATALTDSLDRNGRGAMLAALKLTAGLVAAPAMTFSAETTSGIYRDSANVVAMSIAGVQRQRWTTTGTVITGDATVSGTVSAGGGFTVGTNLTVTGNLTVNGNTTLGDAGADTLTIASNAVTWSGNPVHSGVHRFSDDVGIGATAVASVIAGNAAGGGGIVDTDGTTLVASSFAAAARLNRRDGDSVLRTLLNGYAGGISVVELQVASNAAMLTSIGALPLHLGVNNATAATLTSAGEFAVGITSGFVSSAGRGNVSINGATDAILALGVASSAKGYLYTDGTNFDLWNTQSGYVRFGTANLERVRIDSSGNTGFGTASPAGYRIRAVAAAADADVIRWENSASTVVGLLGVNTTSGIAYSGTLTNNAYAVIVNGSERGRFDTSGRFLVGTTTVTTSSSQSGEVRSTGAGGFQFTATTAANPALVVLNEGSTGSRALINFLDGPAGGVTRAGLALDNSEGLSLIVQAATKLTLTTGSYVGVLNTSPASFNQNMLSGLVVGDGSGSPGVTVFGGNAGLGSLNFADGSAASDVQYRGTVEYDHSTDRLYFRASGVRQIYVASGGVIPNVDNSITLGSAANRYSAVHAVTLQDGATGQLVSSSGTTAIFAEGSAWTAVNIRTGGATRLSIDSSGNTSVSTGALSVLGGNVSASRSASGATVRIDATNTSNTASSDAELLVSVGGASGGDAMTRYNIAGVLNWAHGIDNSDSDAYVIAASGALGSSNVVRITTAGAVSIPLGDLAVTRSSSGATVRIDAENTSNTASSDARVQASVAGTSGGDPFFVSNINGGNAWAWGLDNSDSDAWVLVPSSTLTGSNALRVTTAGAVSVQLGDFDVTRSAAGGSVSASVTNSSTSASSDALLELSANSATAGDAYLRFTIAGVRSYAIGADNSVANDPLVFSAATTLGTSNLMSITPAGIVTIPGTLAVTTDLSVGGTTTLSATTFTGNPAGRVEGTTWSPSVTLLANIASATVNEARYERAGPIVFFNIEVSIDPTSATTESGLSFSLPLSSNFAASSDAGGVGVRNLSGSQRISGAVNADTTNDLLTFTFFTDADVASRTWSIVGSYRLI